MDHITIGEIGTLVAILEAINARFEVLRDKEDEAIKALGEDDPAYPSETAMILYHNRDSLDESSAELIDVIAACYTLQGEDGYALQSPCDENEEPEDDEDE